MPLNKTLLAQAIREAFDAESDVQVTPAEARQRQAEKIADAIDSFIRSGTVQTTVTGTSATGGPVTGTGTGGIT